MRAFPVVALVLVLLLLSGVAVAGEPDWFTRVKEMGLKKACAEEVARHERGVLTDSLHVGGCYYQLGRYEEGLDVHRRLMKSPDRNYAALAAARVGEGLFHLGRTAEARAAFTACIKRHPEAWLDGSVPELCRAWLLKLDGKLESRESEEDSKPTIEEVRKDVKDLEKRLAELKNLLRRLAGED
jgi:tetratricopeptide (TPR) repeat protein